MSRNNWFTVFFPLVFIWIVDHYSKIWAMNLNGNISLGFLQITLYFNQGAILGLFANLPPFLRVVSLSTAGAFLVVTYAIIQYLLPIRSMLLRCGMSIFLGGIIGNVTDRVMLGKVIDFISFGTKEQLFFPIFNLADVFQWVGYFIIFYVIIFQGDQLWMENNQRKKNWINPSFQLKYCALLLGVGISISLISMVFSYTYLRVSLIEIVGHNSFVLEKFLSPFLVTFFFVSCAFCIGLFALGKIISHKIAGPVFAFEKYVTDLVDSEIVPKQVQKFKMRTNDEFPELESIAQSITSKLAVEVIEENNDIENEYNKPA